MHDVKAHETANDNQTNRNGKMCMCIELHGILAYIFSSCFTLATATELKRLVCVSQYNCVFINTLTYLINFPAVLALKLPFFLCSIKKKVVLGYLFHVYGFFHFCAEFETKNFFLFEQNSFRFDKFFCKKKCKK